MAKPDSASERITRLETWSTSFEQSVRREFTETRNEVADGFRRMEAKFADIEHQTRPDVKLWLGIAGLCLTLVTMASGFLGIIGGMALKNMHDRFDSITYNSVGDREDLHRQADKHAELIAELDDRLQREMRDLDAAGNVKVEALDHRLQAEISRSTMFDADVRHELQNRMKDMEERLSRGDGERTSNKERIRGLERKVFGEPPSGRK